MALWNKLRPTKVSDLIGQEFTELDTTGSVIFAGPWGCGKSSAAAAHASAILGVQVVIDKNPQGWRQFNGFGGEVAFYRNLDLAPMGVRECREFVLEVDQLAGHRIFILDEAHKLSRNVQALLKASIEQVRGSNQYIFCTSQLDKIIEPLRDVCQIVKLEPLSGGAVEELIERAWQAAAQDEPLPADLLAAIDRYHVTAPRAILDIVEEVANGSPALAAAAKRKQKPIHA